MLGNHVFNVSAIVDRLQRNKNQKNLYEKVNQVLKGAYVGTSDLALEVREIIQEDAEAARVHLEKVSSHFKEPIDE